MSSIQLTAFRFVDWSFEQLEKHSKELQSLVGNYLLRVASARITATAAKGREQLPTVGKLGEPLHPLNAELALAAAALPSKVKQKMDNLEVAEALIATLDVLKLVRVPTLLFLFASVSLTYALPGEQSHHRHRPMGKDMRARCGL